MHQKNFGIDLDEGDIDLFDTEDDEPKWVPHVFPWIPEVEAQKKTQQSVESLKYQLIHFFEESGGTDLTKSALLSVIGSGADSEQAILELLFEGTLTKTTQGMKHQYNLVDSNSEHETGIELLPPSG
jgi:hypothetical protein